jgi:hypothetical protein
VERIVLAVELERAEPEPLTVVPVVEVQTAPAAGAAVTAMERPTAPAARAALDKNIRLTPEPIQGNRPAPGVVVVGLVVRRVRRLGMVE